MRRKFQQKGFVRALLSASMLLGVALWPVALAQAQVAQVTYAPPQVVLLVNEPTNLMLVLELLCQQTRSQCEIPAAAKNFPIPSLSLAGRWDHVVAQLLEGTKLNYITMAPSSESPGRLLVTVSSSEPSSAVRSNADSRSRSLQSRANAVHNPEHGPSLTDEEIRQLRSQQPKPHNKPPAPDHNRPPSLSDEEISRMRSLQIPPPSPPGKPVPLPEEALAGVDPARVKRLIAAGPETTPLNPADKQKAISMLQAFFNTTGQAPVSTQKKLVLPFPDPDGNPIVMPTANELMLVLPWPDPLGRPILIPRTSSGGQVGSPVPTTPMPTEKTSR